MTMTLDEAIAEVKRVTPTNDPWVGGDLDPMLSRDESAPPIDHAICAILNAVASGDLIPKADAEMAVALAYQRAATTGAGIVDGNKEAAEVEAAILALAPADALAEVEKLRADRDQWCDVANRAAALLKRQEDARLAAEAEVARLSAKLELVQRALEKTDEGLDYMGLYAPALTTPEKDATP